MATSRDQIEELRQDLKHLTDSKTEVLRGEIKSVVRESKTEFGLYEEIRDQFINSSDDDIRKFVSVIQRPFYGSSSVLNFSFSVFQLLISSFLLVLGISVISPSVLNISITQIIQEFASLAQSPGGANATYLLQGLFFITGVTFIVDALNHLRSAAFYLRIAGIEIQEPNGRR